MAIIGIVAIDKNLAIGKGGKLPWHFPADLRFFKETTTGQAVVMGSRTWQSIGRPLPNRLNIVLSRHESPELPDGVLRIGSRDDLLAKEKQLDTDLYVIGGAGVFNSMSRDIGQWIVTEVPLEVEDADVFMRANFLVGFNVAEIRDLGDGLTVKFYTRAAAK